MSYASRIIAFLSLGALAQDVAKVNPNTVTVKVDNERVRVLEAFLDPGAKENQHSHPASIVYVLAGGTLRNHSADGKVVEVTLPAGAVLYREPLTHWTENIGTTTIRMLLVELKENAAVALQQRVEKLDVIAREPMAVEHPEGSLFVAGYGPPRPTLWKSSDRGATWSRVNVGSEADGAIGNSDVDLAVARDGTLYFASMLFDRRTNEGLQIAIGASKDSGATWLWTTVTKDRFADRPWIEVAPDGTAHAIWNDGSGVQHVKSRDRGATWSAPARVINKGGSSHLAIGPAGELAVRVIPWSASGNKFHEGADLIMVSTDRGATWSARPMPGERDWNANFDAPGITPRWVEPLAWDAAGTLYALWTNKSGVWLARSADRGAQWTTARVIESSAQTFFPYMIATGRGELAATWFSTTRDDWKDLQWHVARISVQDGSAPRVVEAEPHATETFRPKGDAQAVDTGGEYLPLIALRDGSIGVVTPIQNQPAKRLGFTWWRFR